jgi:hypothetical protein
VRFRAFTPSGERSNNLRRNPIRGLPELVNATRALSPHGTARSDAIAGMPTIRRPNLAQNDLPQVSLTQKLDLVLQRISVRGASPAKGFWTC